MMSFHIRTSLKASISTNQTLLSFFILVMAGMNFYPGIVFGASSDTPGVAILLVDTDRVMGTVDEDIYGQFLEHINHSVVDGLFAEQIRGQGFEGADFRNYWESFADNGDVRLENVNFENGQRSVRLSVNDGTAGIRQGRVYLQEGFDYDGSVWLKPEEGSAQVTFRVKDSGGNTIAELPLKTNGTQWQEAGRARAVRR